MDFMIEEPSMIDYKTYSILIVDDNLTNLGLLMNYLGDYGFEILVARNGMIGFERAKYALPDLILLDVMMPDIDGFETCRRLKSDEVTKEIPVIFLTALNSTEDKVNGFQVGGVDYITKPIQHEELLARLTTHLRLRDLSIKLQEANRDLSDSLHELKATQKQLVEAEKMVSLSGVIAGIAHEINTPVGIGITAASTLANQTDEFALSYEKGQLKRSTLQTYVETAKQSSRLILKNLQRAAELINSFKQVAVDQTSFPKRSFVVKENFISTFRSLDPKMNPSQYEVNIIGDESITLNSYPGAFSQVLTNLIMNSLTHAYSKDERGSLRFEFSQKDERVIIRYSDNGRGIAKEHLGQIFEPFFTTTRYHGGSGLGLHIVYNLVTQKLKGTIHCESEVGVGTTFILDLPQDIQ